nr:DUF4391 domain-containing protein [Lysobacter sp. BMK333-48F3]
MPAGARVDQRVPKKLLLENGAPTAVDKRLINDGIEEIRWLAALKPATCGVPEFRDETREYVEIAVLHIVLQGRAKAVRLIELMHRAVPYPVLLLIDHSGRVGLSLAHKRNALNEVDRVVLDGEPSVVTMQPSDREIQAAFLQAMDMARQPRATLYALYQGWLDTGLALQAAVITGAFNQLDSAELVAARRQALHACITLQERINALRVAASKASQMATQVEINIELRRFLDELSSARSGL